MKMFLQLLLLTALIATGQTTDIKQKLQLPPLPVNGFDENAYLGQWYTQFRKPTCSWAGSITFTDYEHTVIPGGPGALVYNSIWRSRGTCNKVTGTFVILGPGVFNNIDNIGDSSSGKTITTDIDYKTFNIQWACTKWSALSDVCEDPAVTVATRKRFPPPNVINMIENVLRMRWGISIEELQKIPHTTRTWINIIRNGLRSFKYLQNKLIPALGLKRRGSLTTDLDTVINLSLKEIQNGVGGSEQLRRTLATKYQLRITRLVSRELIKLLDNEGLERRRKNRLRRRLYMSKMDMISCHHMVFVFMDASMGFPRRVRADCGTENVIVAEIQREVSGDDGSFIYGQSTSNQRIERWWGALRHTRSDFWMQQFKLLEEEERLRKDNGLHRFCLQYSFMAFINKQLEEVRVLWNNHSIRSQKKGNPIPGIPEILHKETEVYGVVDYIQPIPNIQNYIQQCTTDFLNFDEDLKDIAESISVALGLPSPDDITEFSTAADLFIVLSDVMQNIIV